MPDAPGMEWVVRRERQPPDLHSAALAPHAPCIDFLGRCECRDNSNRMPAAYANHDAGFEDTENDRKPVSMLLPATQTVPHNAPDFP